MVSLFLVLSLILDYSPQKHLMGVFVEKIFLVW